MKAVSVRGVGRRRRAIRLLPRPLLGNPERNGGSPPRPTGPHSTHSNYLYTPQPQEPCRKGHGAVSGTLTKISVNTAVNTHTHPTSRGSALSQILLLTRAR